MNVFIFFFLTTAVVTAAPHAAPRSNRHHQKSGKTVHSANRECHRKSPEGKKEGQQLLKEVMHSVRNLNLTAETLQKDVQYVFMNEECSCETLCKAGTVLSAYNASDLGLKSERDWRLPRMLQSYAKLQNCSNAEELSWVPLQQLLDKIHSCAQKEFANY